MFLWLVPEEEHALAQLVIWRLGAVDGFECVWVIASVPCLGGYRHWCWREVLHLLELEVEVLGYGCQFCHVLGGASGMAAYEVWYNLLVEVLTTANILENLLELVEETEGWFAHDIENVVAGVLGRHLQSATHVIGYQFARIFPCSTVQILVLVVVEKEVVAHAAADEALLDAGQCVDSLVYVEEWTVVGVKVGADGRVNTAWAFACSTCLEVLTLHTVHIGARSAKV